MPGQMVRSPKLSCGFFAQHQIEEIRSEELVGLTTSPALLPRHSPEAVRARLGGFGFGQDKAFVPVRELSGGERARLNLALVTHDAPGLLILDEPTNHLDMETRESLVEALAAYPGAVVLVSHDWHLVELVADRLWLVENGTVKPFDGDLDAYRLRLEERDAAEDECAAKSGQRDPKRQARRDAAQVRLVLEPSSRESCAPRRWRRGLPLSNERSDHELAAPNGGFSGGSQAMAEALKKRADLETPHRRGRGPVAGRRGSDGARRAWLSAVQIGLAHPVKCAVYSRGQRPHAWPHRKGAFDRT